jgi:hypothetical protein
MQDGHHGGRGNIYDHPGHETITTLSKTAGMFTADFRVSHACE